MCRFHWPFVLWCLWYNMDTFDNYKPSRVSTMKHSVVSWTVPETRRRYILFTTAPLLHEGTWSSDGNFPPSSPPPPAIYWANQSKADNSMLFCDWLTKLTSGWRQVAVQCSTNSCTFVHRVNSFVQLGPNPFCQQNNSSSQYKINL